jgi:transposase InsO family protein
MSRQNYYHQRQVRAREQVDESLVADLVRQERQRQPRLGGRKLWRLLEQEFLAAGISLGRDRFFGVLRRQGLLIPRRKGHCRTTDSRHGFRVYGNLAAGRVLTGPHELLVSDITYVRTQEGFMYLALVMDAYSRKIVGYDCSDSLEAEGARRALRRALAQLPAGVPTMHHSDRGTQYCCWEYVGLLERAGVSISMTQQQHCYENAKAERLNGILKQEYGLGETLPTKAQALLLVRQAVELYNGHRPHTALGYATPEQVHAGGSGDRAPAAGGGVLAMAAGSGGDRSGPGGVMPVAGSLGSLDVGRECNGHAAPRPCASDN